MSSWRETAVKLPGAPPEARWQHGAAGQQQRHMLANFAVWTCVDLTTGLRTLPQRLEALQGASRGHCRECDSPSRRLARLAVITIPSIRSSHVSPWRLLLQAQLARSTVCERWHLHIQNLQHPNKAVHLPACLHVRTAKAGTAHETSIHVKMHAANISDTSQAWCKLPHSAGLFGTMHGHEETALLSYASDDSGRASPEVPTRKPKRKSKSLCQAAATSRLINRFDGGLILCAQHACVCRRRTMVARACVPAAVCDGRIMCSSGPLCLQTRSLPGWRCSGR